MTGNSARFENAPFWTRTSESKIAFGPVSKTQFRSSLSTMNPIFLRCLPISAGQPHRADNPTSGTSTQKTPVDTCFLEIIFAPRNCMDEKKQEFLFSDTLEQSVLERHKKR